MVINMQKVHLYHQTRNYKIAEKDLKQGVYVLLNVVSEAVDWQEM